MSDTEVREGIKGEDKKEKIKRTRTAPPIAKYPEKPKRIVSIDLDYIKDYLSHEAIPASDIKDMAIRVKALREEKGNRGFFQEVRKDFVNKYFPELNNPILKKQKKQPFDDWLLDLADAREVDS